MFYTRHNPPPHEGIICDDDSLTQQHFKRECDINHILERFNVSGVLPQKEGAFYGDFSDGIDFRAAQALVQEAQDSFSSLPATTRAHFANDPGELLDYLSVHGHDTEALKKIGLIEAVTSGNSSPLDVTVTTDTSSKPAQETTK